MDSRPCGSSAELSTSTMRPLRRQMGKTYPEMVEHAFGTMLGTFSVKKVFTYLLPFRWAVLVYVILMWFLLTT